MVAKRRAVAGPTLETVQGRLGLINPNWQWDPGFPTVSNTVMYPEQQEVAVTEGHQVSLLGKHHDYDIGGPFLNRKVQITVPWEANSIESYSDNDGSNTRYCKGTMIPGAEDLVQILRRSGPTSLQIANLCPTPLTSLQLDAWGATAISRCAPINPLADAASTIGELKDGFPTIPNPKKNTGGEYLNIEFGIKPTVSEISDYYDSWTKAEKHLQQLEKDSGKMIRRGYKFPVERSTSTLIESKVPGFPDGTTAQIGNVSWGNRTVTTRTETKIWFSGAFMYHLPKDGWRRTMAELDYLYGVRPGIDTAWELMPWSWLIDWQSNVGDVLKNVQNFNEDGLVMLYGYVMCQQTMIKSYDMTIQVSDYGPKKPKSITACVKSTTQQRQPANPFGFGVSWESLTSRQSAILAALGISRLL